MLVRWWWTKCLKSLCLILLLYFINISGHGLRRIKKKTITNSTIRQYVHTYNILKKYLPTITVDKINRNIYQKFIDDYGQNHAKETVIKINALVHSAVKDAVYDGIMEKDFIPRTSLVYDPNKTWKIDYLNVSEMKQLVEYLKNTRTKNYTSKYMILLAIYTGMRLGEVQGLKWSDINFNFKTITISRSWNAIEHKYQEPKTESSKRTIRVNQEILKIISELKVNGYQETFMNQFKTLPTSGAVNKVLRNSLKELGINKHRFHFHSLRHTHVAYLLSNDVDIYVISKRLAILTSQLLLTSIHI